jgi:hypothetical protein
MGTLVTILNDTSNTDALDAHFIAEREGRLAMAKAAARGEFVRKAGLAALLTGAGVGLACLGGSFLLQPKIVTVTSEKLVTLPGKETIKETVREVPGPERTVYVTAAEREFVTSPGFANAPMRGRIVPSRSARALSFDDGQDYLPTDPAMFADAAPYVGFLGYCTPAEAHYHCFVQLRDGTVVGVPQKPAQGRPT